MVKLPIKTVADRKLEEVMKRLKEQGKLKKKKNNRNNDSNSTKPDKP